MHWFVNKSQLQLAYGQPFSLNNSETIRYQNSVLRYVVVLSETNILISHMSLFDLLIPGTSNFTRLIDCIPLRACWPANQSYQSTHRSVFVRGELYRLVCLCDTNTLMRLSFLYDVPVRSKTYLQLELELAPQGSLRNERHINASVSVSRSRICFPFVSTPPKTRASPSRSVRNTSKDFQTTGPAPTDLASKSKSE